MTAGIQGETWLVASYAVFLLVTASVLERLAWHSHRRSKHARTAGFSYRREFDVWECPAGQFLSRAMMDDRRNMVIYRAPARSCNTCVLKPTCTDSDRGREIMSSPDDWLRSEIGRFHRGISLTLCILAGLIVVVEIVRRSASGERLLLGVTLILIAVVARRTLSALTDWTAHT